MDRTPLRRAVIPDLLGGLGPMAETGASADDIQEIRERLIALDERMQAVERAGASSEFFPDTVSPSDGALPSKSNAKVGVWQKIRETVRDISD